MNEQRFTPGPWELWTSCSWRRFKTRDGHSVCEPIIAADGHPDLFINAEDAALICAAPELLAACQAFIKYDEAPDTEETGLAFMELYADALAKARAAIARALPQVGEKHV